MNGKIVIKESGQTILKTKKGVEVSNMLVVAPEHYFLILDKTITMTPKLKEAFDNFVCALDDEIDERVGE